VLEIRNGETGMFEGERRFSRLCRPFRAEDFL
jgi:hypothetical protein